MKRTTLALLVMLIAGMGTGSYATKAFFKPEHPAYLHALTDLRAARWMLEHRPGNWKQTEDEIAAVREIDAAISEIKKAGIDDHKDLNDHPADQVNEHKGRLGKASEYLHKADKDIEEPETNPAAQGLKERAHVHIREAIHRVDNAIAQIK